MREEGLALKRDSDFFFSLKVRSSRFGRSKRARLRRRRIENRRFRDGEGHTLFRVLPEEIEGGTRRVVTYASTGQAVFLLGSRSGSLDCT